MSTKLYDGLRFKDPSTDLIEATALIAAAVTKEFHQRRVIVAAEAFADVVDQSREALAPDQDDDDLPFLVARERWLKEQAALGHRHALNDPLRFSIVFGRAASGSLLAYPYTLGDKYTTALESTGLFEPYGYWDNTDRPEDITEDEWERRRDDWASIEGPDGAYAHLPCWQLPSSIEDTFSFDLLVEEVDLEAPGVITWRERLARAMHRTLFAERGDVPPEELFSAMNEDRRTAVAAARELSEDDPTRPAPLPPMRSHWSQTVPLQTPPVERIRALAQQHREREVTS